MVFKWCIIVGATWRGEEEPAASSDDSGWGPLGGGGGLALTFSSSSHPSMSISCSVAGSAADAHAA